jgi:hypothetical protein
VCREKQLPTNLYLGKGQRTSRQPLASHYLERTDACRCNSERTIYWPALTCIFLYPHLFTFLTIGNALEQPNYTHTPTFKPDRAPEATTRRLSLLSKSHNDVVGTRDVLQPTTSSSSFRRPVVVTHLFVLLSYVI